MMVVNAKLALLLVSVAAFGYPKTALAYSEGAPLEVCSDLMPQHGAPAQTTDSPYTLTPNRKSVKGGESITLTLASKDFSKFKGFIVQARDGDDKPIGSFTPLPASKNNNEFKGKWKLLSCPNGPSNNTATHANAVEKSRVVLTWNAPKTINLQSFKFKYTVAKNGGQYWVGKESENIAVSQSNPGSTKRN
ncbi:putative defense protein Hdd11 [Rhopalosiphum maidis]|uniref:putative defense protein Hdd11 n=1 Tax=Rhopalosiphum maidis TaxID=43146 RepID=UPI000F01000D|nr:putative defense protein Hdd11 [Rhopalosiphum maidis]